MSGRWTALLGALLVTACGRVYAGTLTPVAAETDGLVHPDVLVEPARADSLDLVFQLAERAQDDVPRLGCLLRDTTTGGLPPVLPAARPVQRPWGGTAVVMRIPADALPAMQRHPFALPPEAVVAAFAVRPASADSVARLAGPPAQAYSCVGIEADTLAPWTYRLTVTSQHQGALVAGSVAVVGFVALLAASRPW